MNLADMGFAFQFLLQHRLVETRPTHRKKRKLEQEIATILSSLDFEEFNEFLDPQGLYLKYYEDTDMTGIPVGGKVWVLARNPEEQAPEYLSIKKIKDYISIKDSESAESCNIWFLHIWLIYLYLIYTAPARGISQVSGYIDAFISEEHLLEAVNDHIEEIRKTGIENGAVQKVFDVLCDTKGNDIPRRVKGFLSLMCDSSLMITLKNEGEYQQTLLGAIEIAEGYERSMAHLQLESTTMDNIVNTMSPDGNNELEVKEEINHVTH